MTSGGERYDRNMRLFGQAGQERIEATRVAVVGAGGLGSHVIQQLAYLGVRRFVVVDHDVVEVSNLNRLVGAGTGDASRRRLKSEIAARLIGAIRPDAEIKVVTARLDGDSKLDEDIGSVDVIFGCLDNDATRLRLTDLASRRALPYIDLASDAGEDGSLLWYGGRVFVAEGGERCLSCAGELDQRALSLDSMSAEQREADRAIYGVDRDVLGEAGPSVVSVNGVVASLGVTEFMVMVTGMRKPFGHLVYRGDAGIVSRREDPAERSCYYCSVLWGSERR
jgi:molybdopterin-synthase adenylyltransferase